MTVTYLQPAIIATSLIFVLVYLVRSYMRSSRGIWNVVLYGSCLLIWSGHLIRFIVEQV